jgi:hypothetical protein
MLLELLTAHLWLALGLWIVVYVADYYLTLAGARLYAQGVQRVVVFEGSYELNPLFQQDIDRRRRISTRFLVMLGVTCLLIAFAWRGVKVRWFPPGVFRLWMGALLLVELVIMIRHVRNIITFRQILSSADIVGQIQYPRWWSLRSSALDLGLFGALFAVFALIADPWFFLGGTLACGSAALQHFRHSRKARSTAPQTVKG